ncbi:MAG: hypothetical protein ABR503_13875 [Chitinophagaceae bacterium]
MHSQLVTSILSEPEFAESRESFAEQAEFVGENLIDEEEDFYPYRQNKNTSSMAEAFSFQDEVITNSPFTSLESFEPALERMKCQMKRYILNKFQNWSSTNLLHLVCQRQEVMLQTRRMSTFTMKTHMKKCREKLTKKKMNSLMMI